MNVVIYSKDRPAQLDLLLRSMKRFAPSLRPIVIFKGEGYDKVLDRHVEYPRLGYAVEEVDFREDTFEAISPEEEHTMFLMDDDIFVNPYLGTYPDNGEILSLRLHPYLTKCYATGQAMRAPPEMGIGWSWPWRRGEGDYGYPMSLDGHIFPTDKLLDKMEALAWNNPNTLEAALASDPIDCPYLSCFRNAKIINVPHNRVQNTYNNRHEGGNVNALNKAFMAGRRLAIPGPGPYPSVHVPLTYTYEDEDGVHE